MWNNKNGQLFSTTRMLIFLSTSTMSQLLHIYFEDIIGWKKLNINHCLTNGSKTPNNDGGAIDERRGSVEKHTTHQTLRVPGVRVNVFVMKHAHRLGRLHVRGKQSIGVFCTLRAGIAPMMYRCTSGLSPKLAFLHLWRFAPRAQTNVTLWYLHFYGSV